MKKRMFKLRRVAAGLLTAFLLVGEIGTGGLKAYAADDEPEEVTEAAVEEEEAAEEEELPAEEEEMPPEEDADGRGEDLPDKSKISLFGKEVKSGAKGTGDSGTWIYKNGVLLLNNFRINTPFPGSSGIVAEGDLEIIVKGNCSFIMRSDDKASAIRTGGNLTITNGPASGTDTGVGKLVVVGNANGQGIGIDCGGDLTIAHVSAIKTLDFEEMIKEPSGILRGSLYVGAAGKKDSAILVKGNMNVLEANVVAEAGGKVTEGDSVAIAVGGKLRVDHSRIEATPGTSSKEEQKNLGIRAEEITLNTSHVAEPRMGMVDVFNGYSQVIQNGGSGWYNETAVIDQGKAYGLCVGGVPVTSENYSKLTKELETVLQGTGASVTYDPILKTLTLENVEGFTGDSFFRRSYIYTETPIKLRGNASIDAPLNVQVMSAKCDGAIDIAGQFSFSSANYDTIWLGNDTPLVIDGDDTVLSVTINNEVEDENYAIMANGGFTMKDGSVTVEAPYEDGIYSLTGPIAILGGTLKAKGKTYALKSENGIELGEDVDILKPADGAKGTVTEGEKSYWTIKDGENVANDVELKSAVHALTSVTQADAVYGDPLPATVVLGGPDDVDPVFSYEGTLAKDGSAYGPATDKPTLPGHYRVTATKTKGEGEDQESWKGSDEFIIEARPVVAEVTAQDRVYTGDPMVKIATATLTNALTDDDVALDLEETYGEMEDENAGENKTVKRLFNATLKGETASNYTIDPDQLLVGVTVNIAKADWTRKNVEQEVEAGQELKDEDR